MPDPVSLWREMARLCSALGLLYQPVRNSDGYPVDDNAGYQKPLNCINEEML